MAPTHMNRSAVLADQKVPATGNPVRPLALLASLSSRVTLFPRVVLPHYQASQLRISSTTNFNGGYSTFAQSFMALQKSFLYVGPINQYGNTSKSSQKATPSVVIAQSYQMGPSSKVDPLSMLNEAKRICDQLVRFNLPTYPPLISRTSSPQLQNPSQLVGQPPPTIYPSVTYPPAPQPAASTPAASTSQPSAVITNPSTFVMPLGMPNASQPIYPTMYGTTPPRYPTAPYYQYPHAPGYYPTIPAQSTPAPPATPSSAPPPTQFVSSSTAATSTLTMTTSNPTGASGAWADEEVERLKRLAEQSRASGPSNETDWDWVVIQWGNTRTRLVEFPTNFLCLADIARLDIKSSSKQRHLVSKKAQHVASNDGEKASLQVVPNQLQLPP
jgi:hypothetical protein